MMLLRSARGTATIAASSFLLLTTIAHSSTAFAPSSVPFSVHPFPFLLLTTIAHRSTAFAPSSVPFSVHPSPRATPLSANIYDDWRSDAVVDTLHLDEGNVEQCLEEFVQSDYGQAMFGCHDMPASVGITGMLDFVEIVGPEVILRLSGAFWHRRETVLGRAAMYLNARIPEIVHVTVEDMSELEDFEQVVDEDTGEVLGRRDKRAPDFNGDRGTMEYQGIDPDMRGPFPQGVGGLRPGGSMINPT